MSLESVKNIVLILSGKGGVGKSSITTQLALSLSLAGKTVGVLDIDLTGPSIPRLLGLEDAKIKQAPGGWLPVEVHKAQLLPPLPAPIQIQEQPLASNNQNNSAILDGSAEHNHATTHNSPSPFRNTANTNKSSPPSFSNPIRENNDKPISIGALHAISLAFLLPTRSSAVIWRGPKKTAMVRQFLTDVLWPSTGIDYLLIDTPPGTSDEHISLAETLLASTSKSASSTFSSNNKDHSTNTLGQQQHHQQPRLAGAIIVTTPQAVAISDVRKEINFCKKTGIAILGVVENMAGFVCQCCGEETDLFGRGGGMTMAREFGLKFLGSVAMDPTWGRLVEEGIRPQYGVVEKEDSGERFEGKETGTGEAVPVMERDEGRVEELLIDKYRSCKLSETFEEIARLMIRTVEG